MRIVFCCIVDEAVRFQEEFKQWVIAHRLYSHPDVSLQAYFINAIPEHLREFSEQYQVRLKTVQQIVAGSPHCNKIIPFLDEENHKNHDMIVVTDSDHHVVADLSTDCRSDTIRLAPNNGNNPPLKKFKELFKHFDIKDEVRIGKSLMPNEKGSRETYINNNSGGVIMIPSNKAKEVALQWKSYALDLVKEKDILGRWSIHVDQIAFALAMEKLGIDIDFLPAETNAVLKMIPEITDIKAFHITKSHRSLFSNWFDNENQLLVPSDNEELQLAVSKYNRVVEIFNGLKLKYVN